MFASTRHPMKATLTRIARPRQTLGILRLTEGGDQVWWCCTSERQWAGNENNVSCTPPAPNKPPETYRLDHRHPQGDWSAFPYPHLIVRGVTGRSYILIHRGNYVSDTEGCVLVGRAFADLDGDGVTDVTSSTETLAELVRRIPEGGCELEVGWSRIADMERMVAERTDFPALDDVLTAPDHLA